MVPQRTNLMRVGVSENLYFDTMSLRRNAIFSAEARTCEWIWDTTFASWIKADSPGSNMFWICGKPGSGKSTLMKYLSGVRRLKTELPNVDWTIVDFFFDFRQKDRIGNTLEGLLRSLLSQVIDQTTNMPSSLVEKARRSPILDVGALKDLFDLIFQIPALHLFILCDGLDEYTGNMRALMNFLVSHSHRTNVKVCLASRPHPTVDLTAGPFRIHMSEQNLEGIQEYIFLASTPFIEPHNETEWHEICSQIEQRADGVFLWVYLVMNEMLHAFSLGETFEEISRRLDDIPDTLESLYQRILDSIPKHREVEFAIIFELIDKAEFPLNLDQLYGMLFFLIEQHRLTLAIGSVTSQELFLRRLRSAGGDFLHFRTQESSTDHNGSVADQISHELVEYGTSIIHVSIMHKTVSSFIAQSQWTRRRLPVCLAEAISNHPCIRIAAQAVLLAELKLGDRVEDVLTKVGGEFCSVYNFKIILKEIKPEDSFQKWAALLHWSVLEIIPHGLLELENTEDDSLVSLVRDLLHSRLATLHSAFSYTHCEYGDTPPNKCLDSDIGDFMIAAQHGLITYLEEYPDRLRALHDHQRDKIMISLFSAMDIDRADCKVGELPYEPDLWLHVIGSFILRLLSEQEIVTSFHVALYLHLEHLMDSSVTFEVTDPRKIQMIPQIEIPRWSSSLQGVLVGGNLFFVWACSQTRYTNLPDISSARDQLEFLLALDLPINYQNEDAMNVCHYLITSHLFSHVLLFNEALRCTQDCLGGEGLFLNRDLSLTMKVLVRLYLLEEYGADFDMLHHSNTLLQAFRRARARFMKGFQQQILKMVNMVHRFGRFDNLNLLKHTMITLDEVEFVLRHKNITGHLPGSMLSRQALLHYYCRPRKSCNICEDNDSEHPGDEDLETCEECDSEESRNATGSEIFSQYSNEST